MIRGSPGLSLQVICQRPGQCFPRWESSWCSSPGKLSRACASAENKITCAICHLQLPWCLNGAGNYCQWKMSTAERMDTSKGKDFLCHSCHELIRPLRKGANIMCGSWSQITKLRESKLKFEREKKVYRCRDVAGTGADGSCRSASRNAAQPVGSRAGTMGRAGTATHY